MWEMSFWGSAFVDVCLDMSRRQWAECVVGKKERNKADDCEGKLP